MGIIENAGMKLLLDGTVIGILESIHLMVNRIIMETPEEIRCKTIKSDNDASITRIFIPSDRASYTLSNDDQAFTRLVYDKKFNMIQFVNKDNLQRFIFDFTASIYIQADILTNGTIEEVNDIIKWLIYIENKLRSSIIDEEKEENIQVDEFNRISTSLIDSVYEVTEGFDNKTSFAERISNGSMYASIDVKKGALRITASKFIKADSFVDDELIFVILEIPNMYDRSKKPSLYVYSGSNVIGKTIYENKPVSDFEKGSRAVLVLKEFSDLIRYRSTAFRDFRQDDIIKKFDEKISELSLILDEIKANSDYGLPAFTYIMEKLDILNMKVGSGNDE